MWQEVYLAVAPEVHVEAPVAWVAVPSQLLLAALLWVRCAAALEGHPALVQGGCTAIQETCSLVLWLLVEVRLASVPKEQASLAAAAVPVLADASGH